uniref:Uncharacterized protein n=1 Tax=Heterorhabditis bacteriophora TaxID=37862 RepID=A0A1I7X1I0_HETBA
MDFAGLIIIGFGTGGIKPCVSAFGGDQFDAGQVRTKIKVKFHNKNERMLSLFFSMFYFSINAGSMISTFISPIFRCQSTQPCLGQDSCYPLAFGIPAILMIIATCLFMAGSFWYKKPPPKENVFGEVTRLMGACALRFIRNFFFKFNFLRCISLRLEKKSGTACQKVNILETVIFYPKNVTSFFNILQTFSGIQMDCRLWGNVLFLPDQVQTLNAVLILVFIPIFQVIIYPIASKCQTLPLLPESGEAFVSVWNQLDGCNVTVQTEDMKFTVAANSSLFDSKKTSHSTFHIKGKNGNWKQPFQISYACSRNDIKGPLFTNCTFSVYIYIYIYIFSIGNFYRWGLFYLYGTPKNVNHPTPKKQNVNVSATNVEVEIHEQGGVYHVLS